MKKVYAPFTDREVSAKIAEMLTPASCKSEVELIYQTEEGLHKAVAGCPGDWYFSGNYPTPGGLRMVSQAYIDYYEENYPR